MSRYKTELHEQITKINNQDKITIQMTITYKDGTTKTKHFFRRTFQYFDSILLLMLEYNTQPTVSKVYLETWIG